MNINDAEDKERKAKNKKILLNVALHINKELFNENKISYKMFKYTEENILKELKEYNSQKRRIKIGLIYCSKTAKYGNATYKYKT